MIDTSPPGSWRNALNPEARSCRACGQSVCAHSDLEFQGVIPQRAGELVHAQQVTPAKLGQSAGNIAESSPARSAAA